MDAATLKLAKNYTNEQVVQKATNSPVEEISFDGGIYSVGNNVVNGQVSDIVLKGLTATNLISNSNFNGTTTGWNAISITTSFVDGILNMIPTRVDGRILQRISLLRNSIYYMCAMVKADSNLVKFGHYTQGIFVSHSGSGNYERLSRLYTTGSTETSPFIGLVDQRSSDWTTTCIKNTTLINLTATFGAGNEPTKEQCDQIFTNWFDGTKSTNSVRIRSVNEDETKESIVNVNLPEPLRSLPNGVKDEVNVSTGVKTQRVGNKTNVASGTVINYADMATGGQFEAWGSGEHVVGVKGDTLAFTATSLNYQLATPIVTKLPAQAPLQVFENGTVYVEPIGDPSETTLPTVELTVPIASGNKVGIATHDYAGAAADWVLTSNESKCKSLLVTNAGGAANIIAPDKPGLTFTINNKSGQAITIKKSDGTGVTITNGKKVTVQHFGTDYEAISSEI